MKIIYIYTALLTKGGADRVLTEKANWFVEHGYEVDSNISSMYYRSLYKISDSPKITQLVSGEARTGTPRSF